MWICQEFIVKWPSTHLQLNKYYPESDLYLRYTGGEQDGDPEILLQVIQWLMDFNTRLPEIIINISLNGKNLFYIIFFKSLPPAFSLELS